VFVFPAVEDFGIMPIESIACGTPAVVSAAGGAREGVQACGGGAVLEEHSNDAWKSALDAAAAVDRTLMREQAARFGQTRFRREISSWLAKPWAGNA